MLTETSTPQVGRLLFRDDFSDPESGWAASSLVGSAVNSDGVFRITVKDANQDVWAAPGLALGDVRIEVDAIKVDGDRNNRFGIICRKQGPSSFYVFLISSDGYYGIGKINGADYRLLGSDSLLPSDKIPKGSAYLHLRADCIGDRLGLYVNGEKIHEVQDADFQAGDAGLIAGAYNANGTEILFDNFRIYKP